jgi:hypothetical protein
MARQVQPTTRRGLERKGTCALCGRYRPLSDTHVPPKSAGNTVPTGRMVIVSTPGSPPTTARGRVREGGVRGYLLCQDCNSATSRWDGEFGLWCRSIAEQIRATYGAQLPVRPGTEMALTLPSARPGAFIRSTLAGMFAINGDLRPRYPSVASAILQGRPTPMPADLWFGLALVDGHAVVDGGGGRERQTVRGGAPIHLPSGLIVGALEGDMPHAAITWPPISVVLHTPRGGADYPHASHGAWLEDDPDTSRSVALLLRAVFRIREDVPTSPGVFSWDAEAV